MEIDADGACHAYHPRPDSDRGLDSPEDAGHPGNWFGVVTDNGKPDGAPVVQKSGDHRSKPLEQINAAGEKLFAGWGGLERIKQLFPYKPDAKAPLAEVVTGPTSVEVRSCARC